VVRRAIHQKAGNRNLERLILRAMKRPHTDLRRRWETFFDQSMTGSRITRLAVRRPSWPESGHSRWCKILDFCSKPEPVEPQGHARTDAPPRADRGKNIQPDGPPQILINLRHGESSHGPARADAASRGVIGADRLDQNRPTGRAACLRLSQRLQPQGGSSSYWPPVTALRDSPVADGRCRAARAGSWSASAPISFANVSNERA